MNTIKVGLLLIALTILIVLIGSWIGGTTGSVVALLLAIPINFGSRWSRDRIILKMEGGSARPGHQRTTGDSPPLYRQSAARTGR